MKKEDTTLVLDSIRFSLDKNEEIFHIMEKEDVLLTLESRGYSSDKSEEIFHIMNTDISPFFLSKVGVDLSSVREIVLWVVERHGLALKYVDSKFKGDREIVMAAVRNNGKSLRFANKKLRSDREIVNADVSVNGHALCYASNDLMDDKEIALSAIKNNCYALRYVSDKLRNDKDVVFSALAHSGMPVIDLVILEYVGEELRNSIGIKSPLRVLEIMIEKERLSNTMMESSYSKNKVKV